MRQTCNHCNKSLPIEQFSFRNKAAGTRHKECKSCHNASTKKWYKKNSKSQKAATAKWQKANQVKRIANRYKITEEEAEVVLAVVACEICGSTENLHVDHDHATGKVRGRLCMHCNHALGSFKDNLDSLRKAVLYLEQHR